MTTPLCTFKTTASPLTKDNLPIKLEETAFLTYTMFFFQDLKELNMSYYYFSTSTEINADFKRFIHTHQLSRIFTSGEPHVHDLGMSIREKIQFFHPSDFAQSETDRMKGTGFCMSQAQLKYMVALTKIVTTEAIQAKKNHQFG